MQMFLFGLQRYMLYSYDSTYMYILVINLFLAIGWWCRHYSWSNSLAWHLGESIRMERSIDKVSVTLDVRQCLPDDVGLVEKALVRSKHEQFRLAYHTQASMHLDI